MLASYSFNKFEHQPINNTPGFPNLHLLEGEEIDTGSFAPAIIHAYNRIQLRYFQWGLIPAWSREAAMGKNRKTAAARNIFQRPSFQHAIRQQRCLIPADSFIFTKDALHKSTQYGVSLMQDEMFCFGGIYECWESPSGELRYSFAIITKELPQAHPQFGKQIPLILPKHQEKSWLNPQTNLQSIARIMDNCKMPQAKMEVLQVNIETGKTVLHEIAA